MSDVRSTLKRWQALWRILQLNQQIAAHAHSEPGLQPIVFFNASARITGLSQNAAFSLLITSGLRLAGLPIHHFACHAGMSRCVLGIDRRNEFPDNLKTPPPCKACLRQSHRLYAGANVHWFEYKLDPTLASAIQNISVDDLSHFEYAVFSTAQAPAPSLLNPHIPLGKLILPAVRWTLRLHTLPDDEPTRSLMREYILSAYNIIQEFSALLDQVKPAAAVIFNGIMYPEAAARWAATQRGLPVITHEVGFQRFSAFFTDGEATAYPIHIPEDFELNAEKNARLDAYLENRFQGKFTMAGIRFWPEMRGLDETFLRKAANFRQIVPVFTNVVYDTSQVHANQIFPHMFAWLDLVLELIRQHPETLFVIRAHPDEMRPGTAKQSRESVRDWVTNNGVDTLPNVVFIDSQEYISSYELIQSAGFVIVYNSSIGMEAALMGKPVLCGGKARYTQYPIVFFPDTISAYRQMAEEFLTAETIQVPLEFQRNARRFLYYQLFRASLSFENYLEDAPRMGFVQLRPFSWKQLLPENSPTLRVLRNGILHICGIETTPGSPDSKSGDLESDDKQLFLYSSGCTATASAAEPHLENA